ncbi:unnamed protein product [Adineta steineri]|uniref:Uncharacterized protein n=1 Tax=Adineta steineri TaxID=433720 RepID=A0A819AWI8_9BILA|nr:unnamed protein product [Adineta steineri]CAF3786621.1 unnamed protein product [Adineta steineri]
MSTSRQHWSWRSCFAAVKHNKKSKKQTNHQPLLQKITSNGNTHDKHLHTVDENSNILISSTQKQNHIDTKNVSYFLSEMTTSNEYDQHTIPNSCIIKIDSPSYDTENHFIDGDSIEQITTDDFDSSVINQNSLSLIRATQLDAIVEDSNEENSDDLDETIQPLKLCCDRDIIDDSNDLRSRLYDLSKMNHVITQFNENGNLLGEFSRQIDKLKLRTDDIIRASSQMPRDAELLEARYSTLLATIESLSILLKIAQIPACRSLLNRLVFSIEQRTEQLNKLVQLTSQPLYNQQQRRDLFDDDFLSFRSALSSYEHLFTTSS